MATKVTEMKPRESDNNVWTISKRWSAGQEFNAMRHLVRVVSVLEWKGEYAVARVEVLGPSIDPMTKAPITNVDPLRFDGRFGR